MKKPKKAREFWLASWSSGSVAHVHNRRKDADTCCADVLTIIHVREVLPKKPKGKR